MERESNSGYVQSGDSMVTRGCDHCEWSANAGGYAELVERYQDHLRSEHHRAWMRG